MRDMNIPEKLTRMVKAIMSEVKSCIRVKTNPSQLMMASTKEMHWHVCYLIQHWKKLLEADLQVRGNIFYKSVQILGYADNLDIVPAIKEAFLALERAGRKMVLIVNEAKTIYVSAWKAHTFNIPSSVIVGDYMFERVDGCNL
jgi:hypothetical protein